MSDEKLMYVHPAPVRVWHWINAVGFVILIITGIQIRFAEMVNWDLKRFFFPQIFTALPVRTTQTTRTWLAKRSPKLVIIFT